MLKIKKLFKVLVVTILIACILSITYINSGIIIFPSNLKEGIDNYWKKEVSIKQVKDYEVYGKRYKLVLGTPINNKKYKYLNCYEEKMYGLYYKSYQASEQGESRALFGFSSIYVNGLSGSNKENYFTIVYGYNENFQAASYETEINGQKITSDISNREYFIDAYERGFNVSSKVNATGKDGKDKTNFFYD